MTTLRQIVSDAYREAGITIIGSDPDASQHDEGFRLLTRVIQALYGYEMGAPFLPISYGKEGFTNAYAKENDRAPYIDSLYVTPNYRLMCNLSEDSTVFLEPNPVDGSRFSVVDVSKNFATNNFVVNANGRLIEDSSSVTLNTNGVNKQWFFRADLGNWQLVSDLTADSDNPFPEEFDDYLIIKLAMRLNPRYLVKTASETAMYYSEMKTKFRAKYKQVEKIGSELALSRINSRNYEYETYGLASLRFDKGLVY